MSQVGDFPGECQSILFADTPCFSVPASVPLFPTAVVGSFPRPEWLLHAIREFDKGTMTKEELREHYDDAIKLMLKEQEVAGVDIVSDGEQRRFSFLAFVSEKLPSFKIVSVRKLMNKEALKFADEMNLPIDLISNPVIVDRVRRRIPLALDEFEFARQYTAKPIKVPLIGPYTLLINSWNRRLSSGAYPEPQDAVDDIAKMLREEILELKRAGAFFVQLDEPGIGNFVDYRYTRFLLALNEWKIRELEELHKLAVEMINKVVKGISGIKLGVHICRGNWPAEERYLSWGGYEKMITDMLEIKAKQLVLEFATKRAGTIDVFKEHRTDHEIGLGVIDVKSKRVEKPSKIVARVEKASKYFDVSKIYLNPDCGFASGRPWPVVDRETAFAKLRAQTEAAQTLRKEFG